MGKRLLWNQAHLRCLLCGRSLGRLFGPVPGDHRPSGFTAGTYSFAFFRSSDTTEPTVRLRGGEQFRCSTCGGGAVVDEMETFSTYPDVEPEEPARPRRGRPPKRWRRLADHRLLELGLAEARAASL